MPDLVANYGAPTDGQYTNTTGFTIARFSTVLTPSTNIFSSGDVGKIIAIRGCGDSPDPHTDGTGIPMNGTITAYNSTTHAITINFGLDGNNNPQGANTAMSGQVTSCAWGHSCDAAGGSWATAAAATDGLTLTIPAGTFCFSSTTSLGYYPIMNCSIIGAGKDLTFLSNVFQIRGGANDLDAPFADFRSSLSARINTATIGATSITLKNSAQASNFTVGQWLCVCGEATMIFGYPPNYQWIEYHQITSIVGGVISFTDYPLLHTYKDTWPEVDSCPITFTNLDGVTDTIITLANHGMINFNTVPDGQGGFINTPFWINTNGLGTMPGGLAGQEGTSWHPLVVDANNFKFYFTAGSNIKLTSAGTGARLHRGSGDLGGPATAWPMSPSWNAEQTWQGFTCDPVLQVGGPGGIRKLNFNDISIPRGYGPTMMKDFTHNGGVMTSFGGTSEIDKCMQNVAYNNLNIDQLFHQNGGNITHITNSTIGYLNGTPGECFVDNCNISLLTKGPLPNGSTFFLQITNSNIGSTGPSGQQLSVDLIFAVQSTIDSTKTAFRLNRSDNIDSTRRANFAGSFVPGAKARYGWSNTGELFETNPNNAFTITDTWQDNTYIYAESTLPWPQPDGLADLGNVHWLTPSVGTSYYWFYQPVQMAVANNTGVDPTVGAAQIVPVQSDTINPNPVHRGRIRVR